MQDRWTRLGVAEHRTLPTPEQATVLYVELAREALKGFPVFDRMEETAQARLVGDTACVIAGIEFLYGGHYRSTSPDVAWAALIQTYHRRTAYKSAFGRFRLVFDKKEEVAQRVYKTAFAMLEAGVSTRAELANLGKPPPDRLFGVRSGLRGAGKNILGKTKDDVPPSTSDLLELPIEMPGIILEREEE